MTFMRRYAAHIFLVATVGMLTGCGDGTDPLPVDGAMHANIVGSSDPWDAEKTLTAKMVNGNLVITGIEDSSVEITLTVYDATVGSFTALGGEPVPKTEATYGDRRSFSYTSALAGGTANVTITELSATKAVGTFDFIAFPLLVDLDGTQMYRITNGTFNVTIR
jgi:hypothetical protein